MGRRRERGEAPGKSCRRCGGRKRTINGRWTCDACLHDLIAEWSAYVASPSYRYAITTYGIRVDDHARMFFRQDGLCGICRSPARSMKSADRGSGLVVDHDHDTGEVRGLLCSRCNTAIGLLADDAAWASRADQYLRIAAGRGAREARVEARIERYSEIGVDPPDGLTHAHDDIWHRGA